MNLSEINELSAALECVRNLPAAIHVPTLDVLVVTRATTRADELVSRVRFGSESSTAGVPVFVCPRGWCDAQGVVHVQVGYTPTAEDVAAAVDDLLRMSLTLR